MFASIRIVLKAVLLVAVITNGQKYPDDLQSQQQDTELLPIGTNSLFPQQQAQQYQPFGQQSQQQQQQQQQPQYGQDQYGQTQFGLQPYPQDQFGQQYGQQFGQETSDFYNQNRQVNENRNTGFTSYGNSLFDGIDGMDENSYCPEYWLAHRQTCYRFIKSPRRNWYEAKKICRAYNADLVHIDNIDKHSFILKQLIIQNQKENRYFISARETTPGNWINDDNSQFLTLDDSFSYEPNIYERENLYDNKALRVNNNRNYNSIMTTNVRNPFGPVGQNPQGTNPAVPNINLNRNPNLDQTYRDNPLLHIDKNRLVYGYSRVHDRWMFMPTYDYEHNLFICESRQLYNIENVNLKADDRRAYDYGLEVRDFRQVPRGPFFIKQPVDTTFDTSKRVSENYVSVSCLAGGFPTPTYTWYKEEYVNDNLTFIEIDPLANERFTLSGGNLIIYDPVQNLDQGVYHCVAANKFGRIRSESVDLNFGYIMEFNLKRSPEMADMNWGKSMFCDPPQHYPGVKYYWSRDFFPNFVEEDQRVFVSFDGTLYFSSIEAVDRANYSCTVQSLVSSTGRNGPFFPLRVLPNSDYQALIFANTFPKVFPEAPVAGGEIRLECVAFGYPVPSYNWTRKDGALPRHAYQTSYNRVLILPNATINDNGEYICTIENNRITLQKSILINIQQKPNFTIPLRDKIKDYNSEVSFLCEASAVPDVNYTWYKNAELLDIEKLNRDRYIIQDNLLTIKYLDPDKDNGMYQCRAENQLKAVYSSGQLRVLTMKPSFKKRPLEAEIYAIANGNTTIVCDPEAAPRPRFQWKKDGNVIGPGGNRRILPTGTLIISPTSRDDEGVYTCVASNSNGTDESRARLIVLRELRFTQPLQPRMIYQVQQFVYMQCEVTYDEVLDVAYIWTHNGEVIKEELNNINRRIRIEQNTLMIDNLTLLDSGQYECIAKSSVNQIKSETQLIVEGPPGAPGGLSVIEIGKTRALIEWVDGTSNGRPILYYNILGRTNWNRTWANVSIGVHAHEFDRYTGRQRAEVVGLTPWSSYEFSVCAVNDLGIGVPSTPSPQYSTLDDKPYIAPRNVGGGGGKIGDLTITWDPLLPQEQHSHGIHYKVFWRLHGDNEWATELLPAGSNVGRAVAHISYDRYYTKYDVKVQAINNVGKGPESDVVTIYSAEDMPQVAPQQPIASSFNSTALNVTWQAVEQTREKIRGRLIGHRLKYWKTSMPEETAVYYLSRTTRPWALIVGLDPDTYYFVKVMVYNAAGEGPESERYLERTFRKPPQKPPSSVHVYGVNPSTVRVVWRYVAPTQEEEPIQGYKVRVWEADKDMSMANDTIILVGNKLECFVDTLTPGKEYQMRVLAFSNGGDGRMSSPPLRFKMGNTHARESSSNQVRINKILVAAIFAIVYIHKIVVF